MPTLNRFLAGLSLSPKITSILSATQIGVINITKEGSFDLKRDFKDPINLSSKSSNTAGESVLTLINPNKDAGASLHMMHLTGKQKIHSHPYGERIVIVNSNTEWKYIIGEKNIKKQELDIIKISMPAGSFFVVVSENNLHGFIGEDIGAYTFHANDNNEIKEYEREGNKIDPNSKDLMDKLTINPLSKLKVKSSLSLDEVLEIKKSLGIN